MAIPKTLKNIDESKANKIIESRLKDGTGEWDGSPMYSDFIYKRGKAYWLIRPPCYGGSWETGPVSM